MSKKRALVCGASQGIGAAVAKELSSAGFSVTLLARNKEKLQKIMSELSGDGHDILPIDLADEKDLETQISAALKKGPYFAIVNNAGGPKAGPLVEAKAEDFAQAFQNHLFAAQKLAQLCLPGMKSLGGGRIINIISTSVKAPIANLGVSNTVRASVAQWAKSLSQEVGVFGITVNNVLPGYTSTERLTELRKAAADRLQVPESQIENQWKASIPLGRFAKPEEIAAAVAFLASDKASYISGINLPVDGGRTPSL